MYHLVSFRFWRSEWVSYFCWWASDHNFAYPIVGIFSSDGIRTATQFNSILLSHVMRCEACLQGEFQRFLFCNFLCFWLALQALICLCKQVFFSKGQLSHCATPFCVRVFTESSQFCAMSLTLSAPTHLGAKQECAFIWFRGIAVAPLTHSSEISVHSDCFGVPFASINTLPKLYQFWATHNISKTFITRVINVIFYNKWPM